jgi:DNA-binding SARP family transcriptional activator/tetratricopeptide (TPR) repeat protein
VEFRVLGPVEVLDEGRFVDIGHSRQRSVLAVLLMDLNEVVSTDLLVDRVWGDQPPKAGRNVLYGYVARLKAALAGSPVAGGALTHRAGGYLLQADPEHVDAYRFRRQMTEAGLAASDEQQELLLKGALSLWHGPALAGVNSTWLGMMRDTLDRQKRAAVLDLNDIALRQGRHAAMIGDLTGQIAVTPTDERLVGQLMLALHRCGRQAEALRLFEEARRQLADELGAFPSRELSELHQQMLRGDLPKSRTGPVLAPRELPADVAAFTGRTAELAQLMALLATIPQARTQVGAATSATDALAPMAVVMSAVSGTAGVGKTALAVHWAHQVADRFPDGQLYVNLRGYDSSQPVMPTDALAGLMRSLGVPAKDIPPELPERAARYRSVLSGRRMIVVLDNARDVSQIRPLLPGSPGCLTIVTSRDSLAGLVAREGARRLDLDLLPPDDAVSLLRALVGHRVDADPQAAAELASQCARLPLALRVAAEMAAARPSVPLGTLVGELADQKQRLDLLDAGGDVGTAVRAVFSWSCQMLSDGAARMFRLLGVHPGPHITTEAAASLAGMPVGRARAALAELTRSHLVTEPSNGRFAFHDVLRAYASEQAAMAESEAERQNAMCRVLDHYLHTAGAADRLLYPVRRHITLPPCGPAVTLTQLASHTQALAWLDAEHGALVAAVRIAADDGFDTHAWQLPWMLETFFYRRSHWHDWAATQHAALEAAQRLGDRQAQTHAHRGIANAYIQLSRPADAVAQFACALRLNCAAANPADHARLLLDLARAFDQQCSHRRALAYSLRALRLAREAGKALQAEALNLVGWCLARLGSYRQALRFCQEALTMHRELGDTHSEPATLDSLAYAHRHLGNYAEAAACYRRAVELYADLGFRYQRAETLAYAGDAHHASGDLPAARDAWSQALAILDDLRHPGAGDVRAKLSQLPG